MIGMREQKPEDCPNAPGRRSHDESHRREPQQAATFVCDLPVVVRVMVHGWSMIPRPSQGTIFAKITGECPEKNTSNLIEEPPLRPTCWGPYHASQRRCAEPRPALGVKSSHRAPCRDWFVRGRFRAHALHQKRCARLQVTGYSITSSARASIEGGTVRPSAFAVFRLTISSNLVGCSTGVSEGLAPLRILSTYRAAILNIPTLFAP